ncbi:alcohol dehydrogenase [Caldovatus aquaticus]|uniref:alcohol dehydrogenase n=1 Tax=Caldovatus aquaticus TaxID=2865671 RepID=A0ABS7EZ09_9PROT|nr:alcohol dehydrogenase [Caldovatus aquaticus]MBW8268602.1 alcohol dehydrogenase [Caldovatus aquaticus]
MRAWAVVECGKPLKEIEIPTPEPVGEQVLLEVTHAGVCHSDIHIWEGEYDLGSRGKMRLADRGVTLPLAMGHEIVGRVLKWGPEAEGKGLRVGQTKLVFPWVGCGKCDKCLAEEDNMCLQPRSLGVYQHGGYATHVLVPAPRHLIDIEGLDPALAATYACSGVTVYSAINKVMPLPPDEPIVLVGAGGLGLNAIAILRAMGHRRIVSVDVSAEKLEAAKKEGASDVVLAQGEDTAKRIIAACGGPVAAVIDLVNGTASARAAFDSLRKGGKLVQVGLFGGELTIPLPLMPIRALTIQGSYVGNPKELRALVEIAKSGKLPPIPITREPLPRANEALMRLRDGKVVGRIVLTAEAA